MPAGGRLSIETAPVPVFSNNADGSEASTQEAVSVTVTDTGTGMSPDVMAHIFEPFFKTKEQGKGTGLGLATVYGIVMQSNGRINVSSEPGIGTRFVITLPKAEKQLQGSQQPTRVDPQRGSETVLLVEDQSELRTLLRQVLESQGYSVLEASSGAEALAFGQSRSDIDLLITDIVMPGMRGWELAHKLSSQSNLKVLYMSGHSDTDLINEGAMLGGGIFLEKPFRPESILAKVREILGPADPSAARTQKAG
jgi:CheY-like chemotaxis protein